MNSSNSTTSGYNWQTYTKLAEYSIGVLFNIVNVSVFLNPNLKEVSYKLMLAKAIGNIVYLIMALLTDIISVCSNCIWSRTYFSAFILVVFLQNIMPFIAMFRIYINITVSVYTYCILINRPWKKKYIHLWIMAVLGVLSVVFYFNKPFLYVISDTFQSMYGKTDFGNSKFNEILSIVQAFSRAFLAVVITGIINIMCSIEFWARYKNRIVSMHDMSLMTTPVENHNSTSLEKSAIKQMSTKTQQNVDGLSKRTKEDKKSKHNSHRVFNIVSMVIVSSFAVVFGEIPYAFVTIVSALKFTSSIPSFSTVNIFAIFTLFFAPALDIFIYYFFNKLYRKVLDGYLKKLVKPCY